MISLPDCNRSLFQINVLNADEVIKASPTIWELLALVLNYLIDLINILTSCFFPFSFYLFNFHSLSLSQCYCALCYNTVHGIYIFFSPIKIPNAFSAVWYCLLMIKLSSCLKNCQNRWSLDTDHFNNLSVPWISGEPSLTAALLNLLWLKPDGPGGVQSVCCCVFQAAAVCSLWSCRSKTQPLTW